MYRANVLNVALTHDPGKPGMALANTSLKRQSSRFARRSGRRLLNKTTVMNTKALSSKI